MIGTSEEPSEDAQERYALRVTRWARNEADQAQLAVYALSGARASLEWEEGLWEYVDTLRTAPYRAVARESEQFPFEVRQLLYRRPRSSHTHRVLFTILEASPSGALVVVIHIRHASRDDISRIEARIIAQQPDLQEIIAGE